MALPEIQEESGKSTAEMQREDREREGKLHAPNTKAGRLANTNGPTGDTQALREFGDDDSKPEFIDDYYLTRKERDMYGVRNDEVVIAPARDECWKGGGRRSGQMRVKYGEARALDNNPSGLDPCEGRENHYMAVPRARWEEIQAELQRDGDEEDRKYKERNGELVKRVDMFDRKDEDALTMMIEANSSLFHEMGIGEGGNTAGMSFEEGFNYLLRQGIDPNELAERAREGGHHRADNQAAWDRALSPDGARRPKTGSQFAVAATGIGKTTQEKVRERARPTARR